MYEYIKENKLYSEDIFFFENVNSDYNSIIKYFDFVQKELSIDSVLNTYLKDVTYIEKIKTLNNLTEITNNKSNKEDISYSLCKSDLDGYQLNFFSDDFSFHKYITSLDYGINCLSYGKIV